MTSGKSYSICSRKFKVSVFASLVLCALIVLLSQIESMEKDKKYFHKPQMVQRKLQAVSSKRASSKNLDTKDIVTEKDFDFPISTTAVTPLKSVLSHKSKFNYTQIIYQLLEDNQLLQLKLNETLRLLKNCVSKTSKGDHQTSTNENNLEKIQAARSNEDVITDHKDKRRTKLDDRLNINKTQTNKPTDGDVVDPRRENKHFVTSFNKKGIDGKYDTTSINTKTSEKTVTEKKELNEKSERNQTKIIEMRKNRKKNNLKNDLTFKFLPQTVSTIQSDEDNTVMFNTKGNRTITRTNDDIKAIIQI